MILESPWRRNLKHGIYGTANAHCRPSIQPIWLSLARRVGSCFTSCKKSNKS